jgi:GNAT superfamily N-acetyltransferase
VMLRKWRSITEACRLFSTPPRDAFANPAWNALHSTHSDLAVSFGRACKYPAAVAPFSALEESTPDAMADLLTLLQPGETTFVVDPQPPSIHGLSVEPGPLCLRMDFSPDALIPTIPARIQIAKLSCADAPAMVGLTNVAFPGYFRPETCRMGDFYGVWSGGMLVAMAGERMCPFPFREITAVCTHPEHRGHGYAAALVAQVLHSQRDKGALSTLWVVVTNLKAIELYRRIGFLEVGEVRLWRICRQIDEIVPRGTIESTT